MAELYSGVCVIDTHPEIISKLYKEKEYELNRNQDGTMTPPFDERRKFFQNQFVYIKSLGDSKTAAMTRCKDNKLQLVRIEQRGPISGVKPRNKEQHFAFDLLLDDDISTVAITGTAGTGKTLLSLATALSKIDEGKYDRIILTKPMSWVGKYGLGYLPGDVDEKFNPYLENYMGNIQHLINGNTKSVSHLLDQYNIDMIPLQLIRGCSWHNTFVIADEVQTLDYHEMATLGTRLGEGSKLVLMGDLGQRDEKIQREKTGLYKIINSDLAKKNKLVGSIELLKCERSATATLFADIFGV